MRWLLWMVAGVAGAFMLMAAEAYAGPVRFPVYIDASRFSENLTDVTVRVTAPEGLPAVGVWSAQSVHDNQPVPVRYLAGTGAFELVFRYIPARWAGLAAWIHAEGVTVPWPDRCSDAVCWRFTEGAPSGLQLLGEAGVDGGRGGLLLTGTGCGEIPLEGVDVSRGVTIEAYARDDNADANPMVGKGLVSLWADAGNTREPLVNFGKVGLSLHADTRRAADGTWLGAANGGHWPGGAWRHAAVHLDVAKGRITTWLDGERIAEGAGPQNLSEVRTVRIGGWGGGAFAWRGAIAWVRISPGLTPASDLAMHAADANGAFAVAGPLHGPAADTPMLQDPPDQATVSTIRPVLRWRLASGEQSYDVHVWRHADRSHPVFSTEVRGQTYVIPSALEDDTEYVWSVRTADGRESAPGVFRTPPAMPSIRRIAREPKRKPEIALEGRLRPGAVDAFRPQGFFGQRVSAALERWALRVPDDNPDLIGMFHKPWVTEGWLDFWPESFGKHFQGASLLYRITGDVRLQQNLRRDVRDAVRAQGPDGYLGGLLPERRLYGPGPQGTNWDLYNGAHTAMALLEYYEATGDHTALLAAQRLADLWWHVFGPGRRSIVTGIPGPDQCNLGVIAPFCWLYRLTGQPRYLDAARWVVDDLEQAVGPRWISAGLDSVHCTDMPGGRIHALEQLFVFEGVADLYRITGDTRLQQAMWHWWNDMDARERMAHGNLAPEELWCNKPWSASWAELCVSTAWQRFSLQMLYNTGDSRVADRMEETVWNTYLAGQRPDGGQWCYQIPVNGQRKWGWYTLKPHDMDMGCCFMYALTGMGLVPRWAAMQTEDNGLAVNWYAPGVLAVPVRGQRVGITVSGAYPADGGVTLTLGLRRSSTFPVWLRIPQWSQQTRIRVNGAPVDNIRAGTYHVLTRSWRDGDRIELDLDMSLRIEPGREETAGWAAIYRGPLLMTLDWRLNPGLGADEPVIDLAHTPRPASLATVADHPCVTLRARGVGGEPLWLCDFASAGATGGRYAGWVRVTGSTTTGGE